MDFSDKKFFADFGTGTVEIDKVTYCMKNIITPIELIDSTRADAIAATVGTWTIEGRFSVKDDHVFISSFVEHLRGRQIIDAVIGDYSGGPLIIEEAEMTEEEGSDTGTFKVVVRGEEL